MFPARASLSRRHGVPFLRRKEIAMPAPSPTKPQQRGSSHDDQHWIELGKRVNDPEVAALIVSFLDGYPTLRARHSGLYLLAAEVAHRAKIDAMLEAMRANRLPYRISRFLGRLVALAYRHGCQVMHRAVSTLAHQGSSRNTPYRGFTVVFPVSKPPSPQLWTQCPKCQAPVGQRQERCGECGQSLKTSNLLAA